MDKPYTIISSILIISSLMTTAVQAAATCNHFAFIYNSTFMQGDGEGMQSHQCNEKNFSNGDVTFNKMQELVKSGKYLQARKQLNVSLNANSGVEYNKFKPDAEMCVRPARAGAFEALMQQIGKNMAAEKERANKMQDAIDTDMEYCLYDDAARIHLLVASKKPVYKDAVGHAYEFGKAHNNSALINKLRQIASNTSNEYLTQENNYFKSNIYNAALFAQSIDLFDKVEDTAGRNSVIKKSESRGDELSKQDNCRILAAAKEYYEVINHDKKIQSVKSKAMKIGENLEKQGNLKAAADCYSFADADNKSEKLHQTLEKQSAKDHAVMEKQESSRKQKFTKDQDDLEKELGL